MARPGQNAMYTRGFQWILTIVHPAGYRQEFIANGNCPIEATAVFQSAQKFSGYSDWMIVGLRRADQKEIF